MPLMRIIFPKGSSQSPSIQCNILQQQMGLRILHSQNSDSIFASRNHSSFMSFSRTLWEGLNLFSLFWVTSVPIDIHTTEISLQGLRGPIQPAKNKISSTIWGALQHPNNSMYPYSYLGYLMFPKMCWTPLLGQLKTASARPVWWMFDAKNLFSCCAGQGLYNAAVWGQKWSPRIILGYFDFEVGATLVYGTVKPERIKHKQCLLK